MRATDDTGVKLNAEYSVEQDGDHLALILESAGGSVIGSDNSRNHQYKPALTLLLERLRELRAVIVAAVVDSGNVQHLAETDRALITTPVTLDQRSDMELLRRELTSAQGGVGQRPGAPKKGNNSKKIRLRLEVPGFRPEDAHQLEADLAGRPSVAAPAAMDRAARASMLVSFLDVDEPVAVLWAIGRVVAGHGRLFHRSEFHAGVGPLLAEFGPEDSNPDDTYQHLRVNADLWEATGPQAGFTRRAADRLRTRRFRAQVIDVIRRDHVATIVDFDGLLAKVGLADYDAAQPTALGVLHPLVGKTVFTVSGQPNTILELVGKDVLVATERSPEGQPVPVAHVQNGLDRLRENGAVGVNTGELGHRSAFVGAVLSTLPGAEASTGPAVITLTGPVQISAPGEPSFAGLDGTTEAKYRKEQTQLRRRLAGDRLRAECHLCGHVVPMELLVAAHIKRRSVCTDQERSDLDNVAMLACTFGCDRLYENGYLSVDPTGCVVATTAEAELAGMLGDYLRRVRGRLCTAHRPESEQYFAWHHANIFRV